MERHLYYQAISRKENNQVRQTLRVMIDKTTIRGKFLISIFPTNIYNRFHRKYGNSLKDFDLTLNDIIKISKYNSQNWFHGVYNRSLFLNLSNLAFKQN